jgi:hypothetical protein
MPIEQPEGADAQDQAEVFDEDNQNLENGGDMRTLEELPDVLDVTAAAGDSDDDDALIGEELDDDEIIELEADSDSTDIEEDSLKGRMEEPFDDDVVREGEVEELRFSEERRFDVREDDEDLATADSEVIMRRVSREDAPVGFMADVDEVTDLDEDDSSVMESSSVSDEDLDRLGYSNHGQAKGP